MVGLAADTGCNPLLRDIDQFDAIGLSAKASNRPGMAGLLEHAHRTLDLLQNRAGVVPLRPVPYTVAEIQAILDFLTGQTAAPHLRNNESARVGAFFCQHMGSRNRWDPLATNPSTGLPCTLADEAV